MANWGRGSSKSLFVCIFIVIVVLYYSLYELHGISSSNKQIWKETPEDNKIASSKTKILKGTPDHNKIPTVIYQLILQGNENMLNNTICQGTTPLLKTVVWSWINLNPDWEYKLLTHSVLMRILPEYKEFAPYLISKNKYAALSDVIMISILHRYGGIYVDGDVLCYNAVDSWLYQYVPHNLSSTDKVFAFTLAASGEIFREKKGPQVASWMLVAHNDSYIIAKWYEKVINLWRNRMISKNESVLPYYWVQDLFTDLYHSDHIFKQKWNLIPMYRAVDERGRKIKGGPASFTMGWGAKIDDEMHEHIDRGNPAVFKLHVSGKSTAFSNGTILQYLRSQIHYPVPNCENDPNYQVSRMWKNPQWRIDNQLAFDL